MSVTRKPWAVGGALAALAAFAVIGAAGAAVGSQVQVDKFGCSWSAFAASGKPRAVPAAYRALYAQAATNYNVDCAVLAGIGEVETDHGRSTAPGVKSGVNSYGCCAGPMQFNITNGPPSTWDAYGAGGDVYDPAAAIPAAARMLRANGAPSDYHRAILAYNHDPAYVREVLGWAARYRGVGLLPDPGKDAGGAVRWVLAHPGRVQLAHACQPGDLRSGTLDPRVPITMQWIGQQHRIIVTAIRCDHSTLTTSGNVSNHTYGRAFDVGSVDGTICRAVWGQRDASNPCARLALQLAAMGQGRPTELIWCWDVDGPADPRAFARPDHCNHVHVGWDA